MFSSTLPLSDSVWQTNEDPPSYLLVYSIVIWNDIILLCKSTLSYLSGELIMNLINSRI